MGDQSPRAGDTLRFGSSLRRSESYSSQRFLLYFISKTWNFFQRQISGTKVRRNYHLGCFPIRRGAAFPIPLVFPHNKGKYCLELPVEAEKQEEIVEEKDEEPAEEANMLEESSSNLSSPVIQETLPYQKPSGNHCYFLVKKDNCNIN